MSDPYRTLPPTRQEEPAGDAPPPSPLTLLLFDQRARWEHGTPLLVEAYLERRPELRSDASAQLLLIHHEVELRDRQGQTPLLDEYVQRFPHLADQLPDLFEVFAAVRPVPGGRDTLPSVPGYTLLEVLGQGGMGVVYKAWQGEPLNRFVALKMIRPDAFDTEAALQRFRVEAGAIARMQHPNVVRIYDFGVYEGQAYCVLEWVEGGSLSRRLGGNPVAPREAAELTATLAGAMHHVHERGVVHRDLKPANVLLAACGKAGPGDKGAKPQAAWEPKVADFGLAKRLDVPGGYTVTGELLGTPSYMAPEQAEGRLQDIGPRTDVYALGAILYELLTGRPPVQATTLLDALEQVRGREPVAPRLLQPRTPRDLETVCLACLRKDPRQRYPSALALADDLRRFLAGEPVRMRRTPAWERAWKWTRRHPARALLGGTGLVAAGAAVLALLLADSRQRLGLARLRAEVDRELRAGQLALSYGEWAEAERHYGTALERLEHEPALADLRWNYSQRAYAEVELHQLDAAEQDFGRAEEALRQVPNAEAGYSLLLTRGRLHFQEGKLDAAAEEFGRATQLRPDDWLGFSGLAQVYRRQDRPAEALRAIRQAQAADVPAQVWARLATEEGNILYLAKRHEEAVERCAAVEAAVPGYAEASRVRGLALAALHDYRRAACAFEAYFRNGGRGDAEVFGARGLAHMQLADYRSALADYTEAFRFLPADAPAAERADLHLHRGWACLFSEAWPLAVADFDDALRLRPDDGEALTGRGYALVKLDDYRRGVADARTALDLGSSTPEARYFFVACAFAQASAKAAADSRAPDHLALATGYRDEAVANLRRALRCRATPEQRWLFWRDEILLDKGLDPIRDAPAFQTLHRELQEGVGQR